MRAAVLYAPKDLRIESVAAAPLGAREVEVRIEAGGICGSDLHYYFDGGFGTVRLKEPMILGHEIAGTVAVCLHAVNRAGPLLGKRVLVTGAGPIGALTVIAARRAGALEIVATDVADAPLAAARKVGADATINVTEKDALARYGADK